MNNPPDQILYEGPERRAIVEIAKNQPPRWVWRILLATSFFSLLFLVGLLVMARLNLDSNRRAEKTMQHAVQEVYQLRAFFLRLEAEQRARIKARQDSVARART